MRLTRIRVSDFKRLERLELDARLLTMRDDGIAQAGTCDAFDDRFAGCIDGEYQQKILPRADWIDSTVISNGARRMMHDWLISWKIP